jgi:transcriptional regulator NrdR family protein
MVMERLKEVDPVAYIRFATVYLDINSVKDFEKLLVDFKK